MKAILERKRLHIKEIDVSNMGKRDMNIKIVIAHMNGRNGELRAWRRLRASASIKLSVFQDKGATPIMGWVRNFHCYTFTDFRDGSLYGPEGMTSIASAYCSIIRGYISSKGKATKLDACMIGDKWYHELG
ncbi:hypothetical protein BDQ12DRAFT_486896 [Crucibulum laeve]|uniref:Uncharacterized protein n=1 Tax=Crucibulum laeve TaxID=68775 RepID=A0A5C3M4I7_9AGAR|nr:hypothetical protein BDQ12DRAFT_486896 [Crucibulum laeve]